jgi:Co/Zn/Cd efflux system component
MTAPAELDRTPIVKRRGGISRGMLLFVGVFVIPFVLSAVLNNYGGLSVEGAIRMAFAAVAGQTIAILTAIAAVVLTVKRGYAWPAIVSFGIIAIVITSFAIGNMTSAGEMLLERLDLIAVTENLSR